MTLKRAIGQDARLGRYRLRGRLAAGGMAELWAAQLLAPGGFVKPMVIKRVLPELAEKPAFGKMLMTEARVAARLSHANVCSVFDLVEDDGECFIAMEYLRGAPLSSVLRAGAVPAAAAVALVAQACDGLHHAHEQRDAGGNLLGLVHRDVSPHNLFVTVDGVVKVLDFGIAKVDDGLAERTEAGKVKGKLSYMSPEQLSAGAIDRRTDVWALGVVLWELLTGKRLFGGGGLAGTVNAIHHGQVPTLRGRGLGAEVERLDAVVAAALRVDRAARFATAAELRRAMIEALAPVSPATADELAEMTWARCGEQIRTNDRCFDDPDAGGEPPTITLATSLDRPARRAEPAESPSAAGSRPELEVHPAPAPRAATAPALASVVGSPPGRRWKLLAAAIVVLGAAGIAALYTVRTAPPPSRPAVQARTAPEPPTTAPEPPPTAPELPRRAEPGPELAPAGAAAPTPAREEPPPTVVVELAPAPPEPTRRAAPRATSRRTAPRPRPVGTGTLSVDARPWATIYADGKKLGVTPIIGRTVAAGPYTLLAVTDDGRTRELRVNVPVNGVAREMLIW